MADANHPGTLATVDATTGYYSTGAVHKITFGNGLTETAAYNKRMQPCRTNVNSTGSILTLCNDAVPSGNVQDFTYGYNPGTANNGNVVSMSATGAQTFNRTYTYDSLNRLLTLSAPGDPCSGLGWTYDAWGNRTDQTVTGGTCSTFHQPVDVKNRVSGTGYQYDAAGNLTYDPTGATPHSYTYDAENRIISVDGGSAIYVYDAQGHRVRKITGSTWTDYVYDASGNVVTEFTSQQGACGPICWTTSYINMNGNLVAEYKDGTTYFVHKDHLGSTRLLTRMDHTLQDSMDFLPYGEQIAGDTSTTHKFTGKERDAETGLDNFGARMYGNALGRFITPDPLLNSGRPWDPQTWNRYAYAHNNPLAYVDPSGLYDWQANAGGSATDDQLREKSQNKDLSRKDRNAAKNALKFRDKFRAALATATGAAAGTGDSGALAAYGSEGDHNGVNVGTQLGYGAGTVLNKDDTISVNFGKELSGNDLAVTVGHEGQHVEDGQAWVAAGHPALGSPLDMNHYERETRAWGVSARLAQALGMSHFGPHGGGSDYYVWNSSWHNVDRVNAAITKIVGGLYTNATGSPLTPGHTGDRYSRENLPPVGLEFFDRH